MSATVTYKGNTLTTASNQTRVLETAGKYMEDDVTIVDVSNAGVTQDQDGFIVLPSEGGGSPSEYTLVANQEVTVNYSSTSESSNLLVITPSIVHSTDRFIFITVRDKVGKRAGYFYGSDSMFYDVVTAKGSSSSLSIGNHVVYGFDSSGRVLITGGNSSGYGITGWGVYAANVTATGNINIRAKYSSSLSGTINGTYVVKVYLVKWPDNISPIESIS